MALDVRVWNLSGFVVLAACGPGAVHPQGDGSGGDDGASSGSSGTSTVTTSITTVDEGSEGPQCQSSQDCPPEWECYEGVCEYFACPTDGGGCHDNDDGYYHGCRFDEECGAGEYCSYGECAALPVLPACAETLDVTELPIPNSAPIVIAMPDAGPGAYAPLVFTDGTSLVVATGDGAIAMHETPEVSAPQLLGAADYDGDGKEDVALLGQSVMGEDVVVTYAVTGTDITVLGSTVVQQTPLVADADLDGDGHLDLAIWRSGLGNYVMRGLGDGTFGPPTGLAFLDYIVGGGQLDADASAELVTDHRTIWFDPADLDLAHSVDASTDHADLDLHEALVVDLELVLGSGYDPTVIERVDADGNLLATWLVGAGGFLHEAADVFGNGPRDLVLDNVVVTGLPDAPCSVAFGNGQSVAAGNFSGDEREELIFTQANTYELHLVTAP
jgi:hypothetical protein